jgi:ribonuclease BN (tRNA processing enzyme)
VRVAREAGVKTVVLFHHDPSHYDDRLDELLEEARAEGVPGDPEVVAAYEGLCLHL